MRSVHVIIAVTVLVVPASAFALTRATGAAGSATAAAATPLPVLVTPKQVSLGDAIEVAGQAPAVGTGGQVVLEARYGRQSAWQRLSTTFVTRHGTFAFHAHPRHSGLLRAVPAGGHMAATAPGGTRTIVAKTSPDDVASRRVTSFKVAAEMRATRRQHDVLAGDPVYVAGRLLPGRAGRTVALQGHSAAGWRTLAHARTGGRGGFAVRYTPGATGIGRHLRVLFKGDRGNARSVDGAGAMTVYQQSLASWYQDGGSTACGFHAGLGVANKTLPCGTKVRFRHAGHTVTATVDDRGPYVGGREWDLNQNTAAALGFDGVGTVWSAN
ncbi:MAG TPA: septal ring lytic transglycosylase RlpA family protein [Solirubrobacteraceae bacterium]|nr:septal ring lytic transglycosylase RlpA family protein [Solirubrobacteraceae bacterium]